MLKWNSIRLRNQILIIFLLVHFLILGSSFFYFNHNLTQFHHEQLERELYNQSQLLAEREDLNLQSPEEMSSWVEDWEQRLGVRITIVSPEGRVLGDSRYQPEAMDNHRQRPEIRPVLEGGATGRAIRESGTLNLEMYYLAFPLLREGEVEGVIRLAKPLEEIRELRQRHLINYLFFFLITLLLALIITWKYSSTITGPLEELKGMAGKIAGGNLEERIRLGSRASEIGAVAESFNSMADELRARIDEISEEKGRAEAILKSMADGVIATDIKRRLITINPAAREMTDLREAEVKGRQLLEVIRFHPLDSLLARSIEENKTLSQEFKLHQPRERILRCHLAPVRVEERQVIGGVVVLTDITELRHLEQVRREFVANVSHELKTPLTSITGYLDTILESSPEASTREGFLRIISSEAERMAFLIEDLLELSRLEARSPEVISLSIHPLQPVVEKVMAVVQRQAESREIELRAEMDSSPLKVMMIPGEIEQVLLNLMDNAIKYTPEGGEVVVRLTALREEVMVEVEDNGIGIPKEDQDRIFERFYRVDKARSRKEGGTGIGLSIVKHILKGHGAEIEVDSQPQLGSTFRFFLQRIVERKKS